MEEVIAHTCVVSDLATNGAPALRHVESASDRSAPMLEPGVGPKIMDKKQLLSEIEQGRNLQHVDHPNDRSTPRIEEGVKLHSIDLAEHLATIKTAGAHHAVVAELKASGGSVELNHIANPNDRSAPNTAGGHVGQWDKQALLSEIAHHPELRHVEQVADRSSPLVEPGTQVHKNPRGELMQELRSNNPSLRHVEETADRSQPQVTATAAMRVGGGL